MKTRLYIAGPMTGYPALNFPAFDRASADLRAAGYDVFSPAEWARDVDGFDPETGVQKPLAFYMEHDLPEVCRAQGVALLNGWRGSKGGRIEAGVAQALGIDVMSVTRWIIRGAYYRLAQEVLAL